MTAGWFVVSVLYTQFTLWMASRVWRKEGSP